ncbi:MAG: hypothetical protein AABX65_03355, partial [Nanoarchaeota archaeon]
MIRKAMNTYSNRRRCEEELRSSHSNPRRIIFAKARQDLNVIRKAMNTYSNRRRCEEELRSSHSNPRRIIFAKARQDLNVI